MVKNRFLLIPFAVFLSAFVLDKIFLLENLQTYFTRTMSEVNYQLKPELYDEMRQYLQKPGRKKVLVYFGNSRALLFNNQYIQKQYPDWILYNFSVPGGSPDYTKFWLETFKKDGTRPDFVLLDHSIEIYNAKNKLEIDEVLLNGIDVSFLFRHLNRYSSREFSDFISKRLFQVYKYRPKMATILERIKNDYRELNTYRKWRGEIKDRLRRERGSASPESGGYATEEQLKKYSEGDFLMYLGAFQFKLTMLDFQRENAEILREMKVPYAAIWVRLSRPYFNLIMNRTIQTDLGKTTAFNAWKPVIDDFSRETGTPFWDMNRDPDYNCDKFSDAGHMSPACYPEYTDYIFKKIKN